jgi:hypothetical protein
MNKGQTERLVKSAVAEACKEYEVSDVVRHTIVPKVAKYLHENSYTDFDDLPPEFVEDATRRAEEIAYHGFMILLEFGK